MAHDEPPVVESRTLRVGTVAPESGDLLRPGDLLASCYEIRGLLGQGGMGQVYEAFDRILLRTVAIKVPWPSCTGLLLEAQALAAIRHPGILTVYAAGSHQHLDYVVFERLTGVDLATHLLRMRSSGRQLPIVEALQLLVPLAQALEAIHEAGIAHRDIKPENIMLAPQGRVVIMDFGVFLPEFAIGRSGLRTGSPGYIAPETIRGSVDSGGGFLVDVYAFGVLAYEVLTGALPFDGATPTEMYLQHLGAPVPNAQIRRPEIPDALAQLVLQMMAKEPSERPHDLGAVAFRLSTMLEGEGLRSREQRPALTRQTTSPGAYRQLRRG